MKKSTYILIMCLTVLTLSLIQFEVYAVQNTGYENSANSVDNEKESNNSNNSTKTEVNDAKFFASGSCGENITWKLSSDGILVFSGTGITASYDMFYYVKANPTPPWYNFRDMIKTVVVCEGINEISTGLLHGIPSFDLYLPTSVNIISPFNSTINRIYYAGTRNEYSKIWFFQNSSNGCRQLSNADNVIYNTPFPADSLPKNNNIKDIINIVINNQIIEFDQAPIIEDSRTLVPVRAIFEALGATVEWDNKNKTVTANNGVTRVSLKINSQYMNVNGRDKILDVPAKIINNRTLVPVRAISEALGCRVEWNSNPQAVIITQ